MGRGISVRSGRHLSAWISLGTNNREAKGINVVLFWHGKNSISLNSIFLPFRPSHFTSSSPPLSFLCSRFLPSPSSPIQCIFVIVPFISSQIETFLRSNAFLFSFHPPVAKKKRTLDPMRFYSPSIHCISSQKETFFRSNAFLFSFHPPVAKKKHSLDPMH